MSSIINKVKDAISSDKNSSNTNTNTAHHDSTTLNTHNNSTTDPRTGGTHSAYDTPANIHGSSNTHGSSHTGTGNYGLGQEANRGVDGPGNKTDGPHKSDLLNKLDPRVDSDGDHSKNFGANKGGDATTSTRGTSTTSGAGYTGGPTSTTGSFDPSGSRVATDSDPRIDPEMNYNQQDLGTGGLTGTSHTSQTTRHNLPTGTGGLTGSGRHTENLPEGTYGQHNSRLANAADPRIDSDLDSRRTHQQSSTTGGNFGTSTTGSHSGLGSNTQSGYGHNTETSTTGSHSGLGSNTQSGYGHNIENSTFGSTREPGPAPNTAGPHKSDMLNKADPRVDSNLDGSKTYAGDKTYDQGTAGSYQR